MEAKKSTKKAKEKPLTDKVLLFCKEYTIDFNGTKAAERSKFSKKSAATQASRLLKNDKVRTEIKRLLKPKDKKREVTIERIEAELEKIAFHNIDDVAKWDANGVILVPSEFIDRTVTATVSEVSQGPNGLKVKSHDKIKALTLLGQRRGMYIEKHEVDHKSTDGTMTPPITQIELISKKIESDN